jgi:pyruvate/2-oxoglutarate dehydrogenase complex dihydrolipoamide acyltransferase (E2) component
MVFPNIEKIKQDYTDKYVMVDPQRPELARFADAVGQVKTVNMSGRALVEFLDYHLNTGWYDIELEFLKVVDKPLPKEKTEKPVPKRPHDKPEGKAAPTTGDKQIADAKATPGVAPTSKEGKPSTADILAKLKGGAGAAPAAPAAKKEAAPKPAAAPAAGKAADRSKMSVADMIAAAKGGAAPAAKAEAPAAAPESVAPTPEPAKAAAPAPAPSAEDGIVKIDKTGMSIDAMVAYCREKDAE